MKKKIIGSLVLSVLFFIGTISAAQSAENKFTPLEPTMPVSQVKPGMKAKVKTVLVGTDIHQFDATLLGIVPRKNSPHNLILIRIDDKYVIDSGGIAAGMSGSPVYVNGRLVGAIGYSWDFGDPSLGLVTPIEEMVKAFDWPDRIPEFAAPQKIPSRLAQEEPVSEDVEQKDAGSLDILAPYEEPEAADDAGDDIFVEPEEQEDVSADISADLEMLLKSISDDLSADIGVESGDQTASALPADLQTSIAGLYDAELKPLAVPLLVDGISPRMADRLKQRLGVEVIQLGSSSSSEAVNLKVTPGPGAAIGASLAWGDFQSGGIGTLTALDKDGRFLAFGHPMMNKGSVSYAATEVGILRIIPSMTSSFKLGYMGSIIGIVTQDRPEAIGGRLSRLAPATSYTLKYHDVDTGRKVTKRFQTVADPFVGPELGVTGMLGMIDDLWARTGEGTAILRYKFSGGQILKGWTRGNIYASNYDIVAEMMPEFDGLNKIFALNQFQEIRPLGVELEIEITRDMRVVYIEKLKLVNEKDFYSPGDTIDFEVTLRPWRKQATVKRMSLKVPENSIGFCEIVVRGGGIQEQMQDSILAGYRTLISFDDLIKELDAQESNNQLILEINSDGDLFMPGKRKKSGEGEKDEEDAEVREGRRKEQNAPSIEDFTDDRLKSEIIEERISEGTMKIIDTNYYVDGLLRKMIMVGGKGKSSAGRPDTWDVLSEAAPADTEVTEAEEEAIGEDDQVMTLQRPKR